jgi:hypothetical protein
VYFARPEDDILLKRLESDVIPTLKEGEEEKEMSSKEWILLQAMRLRKVDQGTSEEERRRLWENSGRGK